MKRVVEYDPTINADRETLIPETPDEERQLCRVKGHQWMRTGSESQECERCHLEIS